MKNHYRLMTAAVIALGFSGLAAARPVVATPTVFEPTRVLYVSPFGDDTADGLTPEQAFRSISTAAGKTQPGDLVLVRGGVYLEYVVLSRAGTEERPIVFRALPGETALVTAAKRPEGWERVPGTRHVFAASLPSAPSYVMDERFLARYVEAPDHDTLDETLGSYIYNEEEHVLNVHPMRGLKPEQATVFIIAPHSQNSGFFIKAPYNRVEGFEVAFHPFGIQFYADHAEAWNNHVYGCALSGIWARRGEELVIANNICYLNEESGLYITGTQGTKKMVGNLAWGNTQKGPYAFPSSVHQQLALYGRVQDPIVSGNLLIRGHSPLERAGRLMRYKSALGSVTTRRNTLVGGSAYLSWGTRALYEDNTVVGGNLRIYSTGDVVNPENASETRSLVRGSLYLEREEEAGFADPKRFDYRLRADSPHLGSGAWPEAAFVRYVSPEGNDSASGHTPATAWRTLAKAVASAQPGVTVYVMPGEYKENVTLSTQGTSEYPVELLTYGRGQVILDGRGGTRPGISLQNARHVNLDGFIFRGFSGPGLALTSGDNIVLRNNVFDGLDTAIGADSTTKITVENCTFVACGKGVHGRNITNQIVLRNNLYVRGSGTLANLDETARAALISERNAFSGPNAHAQVEMWHNDIQEGHPSLEVAVDVSAPDYHLPTFSRWSFAGLGHKPLGARGESPDVTPIKIEKLRAIYLTPNSAWVTWSTPEDYANATLSWNVSGGVRHYAKINQYHSASVLQKTCLSQMLVDLNPGTEYTLTLTVSTPDGRQGSATANLMTPATHRTPGTVYVSTSDGSDRNDGMSVERPLATITAATLTSVPGDTILVGPGIYRETVNVLCSGLDAERRLTLRSERPGEAIVDMAGFRTGAFVANRVKHVTLDGFRIRGMKYGSAPQRAAIQISAAEDIEVINVLFERSPAGDRSITSSLIYGSKIQGLRIRNNLFQYGFYNLSINNSDDVTIDHNTFYKGGVTAMYLHGKLDAKFRITNNIFYDVIVAAKRNAAIAISRPTENLVLSNNLYYRDQAVNMGLLGFLSTREGVAVPWSDRAETVEEVRERFGVGQGDVVADPLFINAEHGDFRLEPDSPAIGMAEEGNNAGMLSPMAGWPEL